MNEPGIKVLEVQNCPKCSSYLGDIIQLSNNNIYLALMGELQALIKTGVLRCQCGKIFHWHSETYARLRDKQTNRKVGQDAPHIQSSP